MILPTCCIRIYYEWSRNAAEYSGRVSLHRVSYLIGQEFLYEGGNLSGRFYMLLVFLRGVNKQSVHSTQTHH